MDAISVNPQLVKMLLAPEVKLAVGRELMARVAMVGENGRGQISLAGVLLDAALPKELTPGQEIRLAVRELTPDRLVLQLQPTPMMPPSPAVPVQAAPMPGGGHVRVQEQVQRSGGPNPEDAIHTVALRYDAPALGPVDLHFVLAPGGLRLQVTTAAGPAYAAADDAADHLTRALTDELQLPVSVAVAPRYEPLDVYA